ncbi:MAG: type I 3-dehydroquinate dehydratase, partial [Phycisphaerales bacterium]|nr:type I 3-dehydroquinate dehydratase [Phycisphaerales bacterium]
MTLIIASAHGAVPENLNGADLLEIRVDGIETNEAIQLLPSLLKQSPIPTIVTCRSISEGGFFDGEEDVCLDQEGVFHFTKKNMFFLFRRKIFSLTDKSNRPGTGCSEPSRPPS